MKTRILIVDNDPKTILEEEKYFSAFADCVVVGKAANNAVALRLFRKFNPDVMIFGLTAPENGGLSVLRRACKTDCIVVVVGKAGDKRLAGLAVTVGARYYALKPLSDKRVAGLLKSLRRSRPIPKPYERMGNVRAADEKINEIVRKIEEEKAGRITDYKRLNYLKYWLSTYPKTYA